MVMPAGVSEDEVVRMALEASAPLLTPTPLPTPAVDAPPTAVVITMDVSAPNWPWEMAVLVDLPSFPTTMSSGLGFEVLPPSHEGCLRFAKIWMYLDAILTEGVLEYLVFSFLFLLCMYCQSSIY
jgi:hypothetical protein